MHVTHKSKEGGRVVWLEHDIFPYSYCILSLTFSACSTFSTIQLTALTEPMEEERSWRGAGGWAAYLVASTIRQCKKDSSSYKSQDRIICFLKRRKLDCMSASATLSHRNFSCSCPGFFERASCSLISWESTEISINKVNCKSREL